MDPEQARKMGAPKTNPTPGEQDEQSLLSERNLLRVLMDNLPDSIYVKDSQARFLFNNRTHQRLLGVDSQQDLLGKTDLDVHPAGDAPKYYQDDLRVLEKGQPLLNREEEVFVADTGEYRWYNTSKVPLRDERGRITGLVGISADITQRKLSDALNARMARDLATVTRLSTIIAAELDPDKLVQSVVDLACEHFGLYHAHIYLLDAAGKVLELAAGAGEVGRQMVAQGWQIDLARSDSLVAQTGHQRRGVLVNDVRLGADFLPNPLLPDTRSELAVPLIAGSQLLGVLDVQSTEVGRFNDLDVSILTTLASQVAVALQNARRYTESEHLLKNIEAIVQERSQALNASQQQLAVLTANLPGVVFIIDADGIFRLSEGRGLAGLGLQPGQVVGLSAYDVYKDVPQIGEDIRRCLETGQESLTTVQVGPFVYETRYAPLPEVGGKPGGVLGVSIDIAERLKAQQEVRASQERLAELAANLPGVVFIIDRDGMFQLSEGRGLAELGLQPGQVVGLSAYDVYKDVPQIGADIRACLESGQESVTTVAVGPFVFETRYVPLHGPDGQVNAVLGVSSNVTERKRLEEQQKQLTHVIESSPDIIGVAAPDGRALYMNPAGLALLGYTQEDLQAGRLSVSLMEPDLPEDALATALAAGSWAGEVDVTCKDGRKIPVSQVVTIHTDDQGNLQGIATIARDITTRRQAEALALAEKNLAEAILDSLPGAFYMFDTTGQLIRWNDNYARVIGYSNEETARRNALDAIAEEDRLRVAEAIQGVFVGGENSVDALLVNREGEKTPYFFSGKRMMMDEALYVLGLGLDISDRKRAEEAVRASQQQLAALAANLPGSVFILDKDGIFQLSEGRALPDLGLRPGQVVGQSVFEVYKDLPSVADEVRRALAGDDDFVALAQVGNLYFETRYASLRDAEGNPNGALGVALNVTERIRLEQQVQTALERRGYQVQVSTQIAQEIAAAPDLQTLFERVVTLVKEQFGYYHAQILRYDPTQQAVMLAAGYGETGQKMLEASHRLPMGVGLIGTAAAAGQTTLRSALKDDPEWQPNPLLPDTQGEIAVPIKLRSQVLGVLDVQSAQANALGEDDRLLLEGLCGQIAIAIEDTRLRQEMEERLNELNRLYRATSREGWEAFRQQARTTLGYTYESSGLQPVEETQGQPEAGVQAAALAVRGEVIGALGVVEDPERPLTPDEKHLIEQVSEQVAQALESARLFEQTQTTLSQTELMYTGSAQIVACNTLEEVLEALARATPLGSLDHINLQLFDHAWGDVMPKASVISAMWKREGVTAHEAVGDSYDLSLFPAARYLRRDEPLLFEDLLTDERVDENTLHMARQMGWQGMAFWPLVASGEWIGLLLGQSRLPLDLSASDQQAINSLVSQAALVIQGIRLQEGMRERVNELTNLQRLMSRDAWAAYQTQTGERRGYLFDRVNLNPLAPEALTGLGGSAVPAAATAAPLAVRGEPIGMLGVRPEVGRSLSLEEEAFLEAVSEQVAQALERARLMEQTQKSAVELQAVAEVSTTTATILDPNELLQEVVDLTKSRFGLYHAHIYLLDEAGENLVLTVGSGEVGQSMTAEGWYIPLAQRDSLVAWVGRERRGKIITDVRQEAGYLVNSLLPNTLSELAVPMIIANRLLGVFDVQASTANRFTESDIRTYSTLAAQIAVALQNAKLYAEQLATVGRLRELDNMKSAFLANMSHELRTPLNSILGFTQVIMEELDGPLTDLMVSDLELIEKNGKHLLSLINDVLDMAKIEAGRTTLSIEPVNLYDMLDEVILTNAALARDKSLYIHLEADPAGDWIVMADHVRIRQILINLLGNSIKFTETGGITVDMKKVEVPEGQEVERVRVLIRDTGIGIPASKLEDIFEAFSQVDNSTTRKAGGTGLGLPISRRLVELHGGKLWAESEGPGTGSTLVMELPINRVEA